MATNEAAFGQRPGKTILGHPAGLYVLFFSQLWERFSYFGMLALLILYLNQYFKLPQDEASAIFKWYTSAIYFTPLVGAYLADRFLGNKLAVLIGALLMALGHFLMAFPSLQILYAALILLVVGCGMLTSPLTTQVGLLYPPNDPRRDSAYTIFYMGINLGALVSPILCGWLADNTRGRFHSGFTVAGIGMVVALLTYLVGLRWIVQVDQRQPLANSGELSPLSPSTLGERVGVRGSECAATSQCSGEGFSPPHPLPSPPSTGARGEITESVLPWLNHVAPRVLIVLGIILALIGPAGALAGKVSWDTVIFLELAAIAALMFGAIAGAVHQAMRDRVLAILVLTVFSTFYLIGAGQSGNAINLWADQNTNRRLDGKLTPPDLFAEPAHAEEAAVAEAEPPGFWDRWTSLFERLPRKEGEGDKTFSEWWSGLWNPVPTPWFQSINPLLILLLAPGFAVLWTWLGRRGLNPSVPTKMGLGLLLMASAFALMWLAAAREAQETTVAFRGANLPAPLVVNAQGQVCQVKEGKDPEPCHAGRLWYDAANRSLKAIGVFPDLVRDQIVGATAPAEFVQQLEKLQKSAAKAAAGPSGWSSQIQLTPPPQPSPARGEGDWPPGFDLRYAGFGKAAGNKDIHFDPVSRTLKTTILLEEKEMQGMKVAAGDPELRSALDQMMIESSRHRVGPWWLLGFFLLATLGELCLLPVGMSTVSQLAPARFATMLMGLWLLTFAFGNFLAGALGEKWGTWTPADYFVALLVIVGGAALVLSAMSRKIGAMMHELRRV